MRTKDAYNLMRFDCAVMLTFKIINQLFHVGLQNRLIKTSILSLCICIYICIPVGKEYTLQAGMEDHIWKQQTLSSLKLYIALFTVTSKHSRYAPGR